VSNSTVRFSRQMASTEERERERFAAIKNDRGLLGPVRPRDIGGVQASLRVVRSNLKERSDTAFSAAESATRCHGNY